MPDITIKDLKQRHIEEFLKARRDILNQSAGLDADGFATSLAGFAVQLAKKGLESEQYDTALAEFVRGLGAVQERAQDVTNAEEDGLRVRAAARCGWFDDLEEEGVGDLEPWRVDQLSDEIATRFNDAMTVPEN